MVQFKYKAQTMEGKKESGILNAADEGDLQQQLKEKELFLLSVSEVKKKVKGKEFKPQVLAGFSKQLSTLAASGVTLVRALNIIAGAESVKPKEKAVYDNILTKIRQGISLSEAMEQQNGSFPPLMIYMFRSAESGGNLDQVALKMSELYEKEHKLKSKISSSMTYPKILAVMIIGVILILTNFVMPQFEDLFSQMDVLPLPTLILMAVSGFVQKYWYLLLGAMAGIWLGMKALMKVPKVRIEWHKVLVHIPVFGKLQKVVYTSRFSRTLCSLYSAGVPIVSSLQIAKRTIGNDYVEQQFDQVIAHVRAGNNLSDGIDMIDGFVKKLSDAIRVGEETGSLDSMLLSTADSMEYDADMAINKMVSYVEPLMLMIMGVIVAFVIVAVFGAIYGSYDAIGGL